MDHIFSNSGRYAYGRVAFYGRPVKEYSVGWASLL